MSNIPERKYQTGSFRRSVVFVLICVLGYLCQVCIMPYVTIFGITPNLLFVMVGIVTVAYGKLRAFWVGTIYGLLMEIMCPSVPILNLYCLILKIFHRLFETDLSRQIRTLSDVCCYSVLNYASYSDQTVS